MVLRSKYTDENLLCYQPIRFSMKQLFYNDHIKIKTDMDSSVLVYVCSYIYNMEYSNRIELKSRLAPTKVFSSSDIPPNKFLCNFQIVIFISFISMKSCNYLSIAETLNFSSKFLCVWEQRSCVLLLLLWLVLACRVSQACGLSIFHWLLIKNKFVLL